MSTDSKRRLIPWMMAGVRAGLGPVLVAGVECGWNGLTLASVVVVALVSDVFDGVLARRWGCDTDGVRLFDSMADTVFYLCTALALWLRVPAVWRSYGWLLAFLLAMEVLRFGFDFVKFGKPASYHTYLAKTWGLVMAVAVVAAFAMARGSALVPVALGMGILCDAEGLAMSVVMPVWRKDVTTLGMALRLRGDVAACRLRRWRERRRVVFTAFLGIVVGVGLVTPAFAVDAGQVAYTGGTLHVAKGTIGSLEMTSPTALTFLYGGSSGGQVEIDYRSISNFDYTSPVAHHLGLLPFIARGLLRPKQRKHFFSIRYKDSSGVVQVAVFEVAKNDPLVLLEVLRARAPQVCTVQRGRCGVGNETF
jgi:CDP-diacylglycerol--glycerol-3-phosphate 3-phosphatidyltransferase